MALGFLLWVALINFSFVLSSIMEGQSLPDAQIQLGDELFNSLTTDGDVLDKKPSGPALIRYSWPSAPANQNPPNTIDQPEPQTLQVNFRPQSVASPNAAEWSGLGNELEGPSVHVSPPRKPAKDGQPSNNDWMSMPFSDIFNEYLFFGQMGFVPENSASYETYWAPMRFPLKDSPLPPPLPQSRKSLIRKSKNGYQRARLLHTKDAFWSDVGMQKLQDAKKSKFFPRKVENPQDDRKM